MRRDRLWLCGPPLALAALDLSLTVWGQHELYWTAGYDFVQEGSPYGRWLLRQHPLAFAAGGLALLAGYTTMILLLSRTWARVAALAATMGHAHGSATWLLAGVDHGYWLALALFIGASATFVAADRSSRPDPPVEGPPR